MVLMKLLDLTYRFVSRNRSRVETEESQLRRELKADIEALRKKVDELSREVDHWKDRYYTLEKENVELRAKCATLEHDIQTIMSR